MVTTSLGGDTPGPSVDNTAIDRLAKALEDLVNGQKGATSSGSTKSTAEENEKKRLKAQKDRYKLEEQIHKQTYDVLVRLNKARQAYEKKSLADNMKIINDRLQAERKLQAQRSAAMNAEAKAQEAAKRAAERRAQREIEASKKAVDSAADRRQRVFEDLNDKVFGGGTLNTKDYRKAQRAGIDSKQLAVTVAESDRNKANKLAAETNKAAEALAKLKRYIVDVVKDGGKLTYKQARRLDNLGDSASADAIRNKIAKDKAQAFRDEQQAYYNKISGRVSRGKSLNDSHLERAQELNMPGLARQISALIAKAVQDKTASATKKRVEDFEIAQHNKQVDIDRKAKAKADAEANKPTGAKGGSFFGGFGRNLVIGKLYAAAHVALAPLEAFGTGVGVHWLKAWKSLTDAAMNAGQNLSHTSGMAESANQMSNTIKITNAKLEKLNAQYDIMSAPGSRVAAGMVGSSASLAKGVAGSVGNAMDNPLQGLTGIVDKIGNAVGMADPGTMNRYNMVLRDLTATIGQGLAPVVHLITKLMKEFGDYLQPVIQDMLPKIKQVMSDLFKAIQPLIPLFVKELTDTIKELVDLMGQMGGKLGVREMVMRGVGVNAEVIKAGPNANVGAEVNKARLGMVGGGMLGGAAIGGFVGGPPGALIGAGVGGFAGLMNAPAQLDQGGGGGNIGIGGIMNQIANMRKGNIAGAAVAQNATIGSGADLGRRASQEAFIASSAKGNIDDGNALFKQAAQAALQFFLQAGKPAPAANGNAQAGIAPGKGEGAMAFGAGQSSTQKVARSFLYGMINPFGVFG